MNIELQENNGSNPSKQRFVFEDHNDFIKREPVINEELENSPDIDAVKTAQDEPNQSDKNDLSILIETKLNFPIENQTKVLETFAPNTVDIAKHYTILTSEYSNNPIMPELNENNLPNETHVEIKSETLEPIAEVDVKEHITFEPFVELDIKENIVKTEENVVKQPLGIEDVRDNLKNGKSFTQYLLNSNEISYENQYLKACDHCEYQTERKANLVKHIFARHMPKQNKKTGRKRDKYTCNFCDKKFPTKCKMYEHNKTHNGNNSYKCRQRSMKSLKMHLMAAGIEPFVCNLCKYIACTSRVLKNHMAKFHDLKFVVYNCNHCQLSFSQKDHLIAHLKLQLDDYKICPYTNNKTKEEKEFIDNFEMQSEQYECGTCPFKCTNRLHLKALINKYNITLKKKPAPVKKHYSCQCCKFKSMTETALNQHLKMNHQLLRPYYCKLCDCKYSVMRDLVKHIKLTHLARKK